MTTILIAFPGLYEPRYYEPDKGSSELLGPELLQARRHVTGANSEANAPFRIATAKSVLQNGTNEGCASA